MGIKEFFKKLGSDTKKAFSKGGAIDTGFRKVGNTLVKVGGVASKLAPLASILAPELAPAIMAGSALANVAGKTTLGIRKGAKSAKDLEGKTQNIVGAITGGIQAGKDVQKQNPDLLNFE